MMKNKKKLITAIAVVLSTATVAATGIGFAVSANAQYVGKEAAKEIALEHAGLSDEEVEFTKVKLDRDDGKVEYEVEFRKDGVKYEYDIDAESGAVVSYEVKGNSDVSGTAGSTVTVSVDEAKRIALAHADLTETEVEFTKVKLDRDDGIVEYEIEFRKDSVKYEYEIDAESGSILSYSSKGTDKTNESATGTVTVSVDEAKRIALAHAGLTETEVEFTKVKLDRDDGIVEYEIEFRKDSAKYEYEIDAESGSILSYSSKGTDKTNESATGTVTVNVDEAKRIALAHAGLTEAEVVFTKAKLDRDDGRIEYEIEFRTDNVEYEYEIDAESGMILSYDIEMKNTSGVTGSVNENSQIISTEQAKQIALAHAGLTEAEVVFTKAKLDRDDGRTQYVIKFNAGSTEYEYDIDAASGIIVGYEQEYEAVG